MFEANLSTKQETKASDSSSSENACDTVSVNAFKASFSTSTTAADWGPVASHNTVSLKVFEANFNKTTATDWLGHPHVEKLLTLSL
jgi:hypothetical protein